MNCILYTPMLSFESLFIASISLLGFISLFIIFRYRTIDIYVDNKKNALRLLLEREIQKNPKITVYIQSLGKNQDETDLLIDFVNKNSPKKKNPIEVFNDQIIDYRKKRKRNIILGLISIGLWTCLTFFIIFNIFSVKNSNGIFVIFILFTLIYIFMELSEGFLE